MNKSKFLKLLILILWMGIIFCFSNQPNSGQVTHDIIEETITTVKTDTLVDIINFIIRKSAHMTEYFILTILFVSLYKEYTNNKNKIIIISIISCFLYACTDEIHQLFIIGRTGQFIDVLIDTIGGLLFIIPYYIYINKENSKITKL